MSTVLDFIIQPLSAEGYSLTLCERGSSQPLASAIFSHRVDFLTDFSVDRLNTMTKDAADRFDELQKLGRELYQKLFQPPIEKVWRDYKQCSDFLILCLRFADAAAKLEVLPWETLHDGAEFIAAGTNTTLTRLPLDVPVPDGLPPLPAPLRLFGFFASPLDLADHERLNAEREQEILLEAINDPAGQGRLSAEFEDEAKLAILERSLKDGFHILHFTGHGISPRDGGGLLLEDAHGHKLHASVADVMQAVQAGVATLRLAVISGCQTARTLHSGAFNDLARALLRQRVAAVIAMQFSISDEGGLKYAAVLYQQIAQGVTLERAVHAARRALLDDQRFFLNNDALAIVLLAADSACLQTTASATAPPPTAPAASYHGDRLDPLAHGFYGRRREYRTLRDALLHQGHRAVVIHGIGGIGKTALLTHAIQRLRPHFKDVMSFDCRRAALAPETILLELHRYFAAQGRPQLQALIGQNVPPDTLAHAIARLLTEWPLLIVFDNFESQLDEQRRFINEDLRVFLTALLQATAKSSRFLFTTRYLFELDAEQPSPLLTLPLGDLSRAEGLMLMQKLPNLAQAAHRHKLAALEKFGGHPFALVILDRHCSHQPLDQALRDVSLLESELREFLAIELNYRRLSGQARELLNRLAAFRQAVSLAAAEWVVGKSIPITADTLKMIWEYLPTGAQWLMRKEVPFNIEDFKRVVDDPNEVKKVLALMSEAQIEIRLADDVDALRRALGELNDWGLLVKVENEALPSVSVHSLVRNYCRYQQSAGKWREKLRDAAWFFVEQTRLINPDDKSQDAVWNEVQAFELLLEAEDFDEAATILLNYWSLLDRWGYGRFVENQFSLLASKVSFLSRAKILRANGLLLQGRGEFELAIDRYQAARAIFEEVGEHDGVARSLHQIGVTYSLRGEYKEAEVFSSEAMSIFQKLDARDGYAASLFLIGQIEQAQGQFQQALEKYERTLQLMEELGNFGFVATALHQIGVIHQKRLEFEEALVIFERVLQIRKELNIQQGIAAVLFEIGRTHHLQNNFEKALGLYEEARRISLDLGARREVAYATGQIGMIYFVTERYEKALELYESVLEIAREQKDRESEAICLYMIGRIYHLRNEREKAFAKFTQSLEIRQTLGILEGITESHVGIAVLLADSGRYREALHHLCAALSFTSQVKSLYSDAVMRLLSDLRARWGRENFDSAWREDTNQNLPEWVTSESATKTS